MKAPLRPQQARGIAKVQHNPYQDIRTTNGWLYYVQLALGVAVDHFVSEFGKFPIVSITIKYRKSENNSFHFFSYVAE